jgi:hypothetical protein
MFGGVVAAAGAVHDGISCDGCGASPLRGVRYRCAFCPNYDLCAPCLEAAEAAPRNVFGGFGAPQGAAAHAALGHLFLRVPTPAAFSTPDSWLLASRAELAHPGSSCDACKGAICACPIPPAECTPCPALRACACRVANCAVCLGPWRALTVVAPPLARRRRVAHHLHALRRAPVRGVRAAGAP